jgi:hypothetical protein
VFLLCFACLTGVACLTFPRVYSIVKRASFSVEASSDAHRGRWS